MGLLSTLSLNTRITKIDIYGPQDLVYYLFLSRKYSQTNFRYKLRIYALSTNFVLQKSAIKLCLSRSSFNLTSFDFHILIAEKPGRFNLIKALESNIPLGPLFGFLKLDHDFLLPDGCIIYGESFIRNYVLGNKLSFIYIYISRLSVEIIRNATYLLCR